MQFFRRLLNNNDPVVVVSGLPRSGTSLMMQMLNAGGLPVLTDYQRASDENNPKGYYEYEPVKRLRTGEDDWLSQASGRCIKVISALLPHLPGNHPYQVIFMLRDVDEILQSQARMRRRLGQSLDDFNAEKLRNDYTRHLKQIKTWLAAQTHIETLYVQHRGLFDAPHKPVETIIDFLDRPLNVTAMRTVIDPDLYRERS
jgi:hypothetical protein